MNGFRLHGMNTEPLPEQVLPTMPDGKVAILNVDQAPALEHNRNFHGWPANAIQEYMNNENVTIAEMQLKNLQLQDAYNSGLSDYSDEQKAALCVSRSAQTASEFTDEALRISNIKERIDVLRNRKATPALPVSSVTDDDKKIIDNA